MVQDTKTKVISKINEIKSNVESFLTDVNVKDLKSSLNLLVKDAQKDFTKLVEKDLVSVKKKLQSERKVIEKKAKKFLDGQRKELNTLQAKIEKILKRAPKTTTAKKPMATKKKVSKKVAKVAKKVAKKTSKKA